MGGYLELSALFTNARGYYKLVDFLVCPRPELQGRVNLRQCSDCFDSIELAYWDRFYIIAQAEGVFLVCLVGLIFFRRQEPIKSNKAYDRPLLKAAIIVIAVDGENE